MPDIVHDFPIKASAKDVFLAPATGATYELGFGPRHAWEARVVRCEPFQEFELELVRADDDWVGTRVGFSLGAADGVTHVRFHHAGWRELNEHHRISCYCWAMYLRILKRNLEYGEVVPYESRLEV